MRVVVDTDPGVDDALALLYLAATPEVTIEAVGSVHGNVRAELAAANALKVLDIAGLPDVPVAIGARCPLVGPLRTGEFVHGTDGLGGAGGAPSPRSPVPTLSAAEQLVTLARANPGELTLLALGPLTNVALAIRIEPTLPTLLASVVVMGGAIVRHGNASPKAEANVWHDPEAADIVLGAGLPLTLVPLDATDAARANEQWLTQLRASGAPAARFAAAILADYARIYATVLGEPAVIWHDPLAAAIAVDPDLATYEDHIIDVELDGTHTRGITLADLRGFGAEVMAPREQPRQPVAVATTVDGPTMLCRLMQALQQP